MNQINHFELKEQLRKTNDLTGRQKRYLIDRLDTAPDAERDDFGAVLNCAVRYSLGRQTYMPSLVVGYIRHLLPVLDDRTLSVMEKDIAECENYGADFDAELWLDFLSAIRQEMKQRRENNETD